MIRHYGSTKETSLKQRLLRYSPRLYTLGLNRLDFLADQGHFFLGRRPGSHSRNIFHSCSLRPRIWDQKRYFIFACDIHSDYWRRSAQSIPRLALWFFDLPRHPGLENPGRGLAHTFILVFLNGQRFDTYAAQNYQP